jgi:hypothetical protein
MSLRPVPPPPRAQTCREPRGGEGMTGDASVITMARCLPRTGSAITSVVTANRFLPSGRAHLLGRSAATVIRHGHVRVPATDAAEDKPRALPVARRYAADQIGRAVSDGGLAGTAGSPCVGLDGHYDSSLGRLARPSVLCRGRIIVRVGRGLRQSQRAAAHGRFPGAERWGVTCGSTGDARPLLDLDDELVSARNGQPNLPISGSGLIWV